MSPRRLYSSLALMLLAGVTPLALAEGVWWFWAITASGIAAGWWTTVYQHKPLIGMRLSRALVIAAFVWLLVEYFVLMVIPVVALSHFMILVCVSKLLQERTHRDTAQVLVLSLLLLVVAAIVSGNLLFPLSLAAYMTVGLDTLIRFHFALEADRIAQRNRRIEPSSPPNESESAVPPLSSSRVVGTTAVFSLAVGVAIFVLFPRVGAGMFGRLDTQAGGRVLTGFANSLNLNSVGPIQESDRMVMRVQIETGDGGPSEISPGPYFRGAVLTQYHYGEQFYVTGNWEWKRPAPRAHSSRIRALKPDDDGNTLILPQYPSGDPTQLLVQRYWIEPVDNLSTQYVFTCYPALQIHFDTQPVEDLRHGIDDEVLPIQRAPNRVLRYTVHSARAMSPALNAALQQSRQGDEGAEPKLLKPDGPLPRATEIAALSDRLRRGLGPLDVPANRLAFARRVKEYLHSPLFEYTLDLSPVSRGTEPLGEFLFVGPHRGHCEYFAGAMTLLCQVNDVPARVVNGYAGGNYNAVGRFYVIRQKHAHSWVEVYVPGMDWVTFDPTPMARASQSGARYAWLGLNKYLDYFQFQWANFVVAYDADQRRTLFGKFGAWLMRPMQNEDTIVGAVAAFVRELFGWRLDLNWEERMIYWVFALLIMMLTVLVGYVVVVVSSWPVKGLVRLHRERIRRPGAHPDAAFYQRFCRRMESWGLTRRMDQTPAEFAAEVAARIPACADAPELVRTYYEIIFGRYPLSAEKRSRIDAFLARLGHIESPVQNANS